MRSLLATIGALSFLVLAPRPASAQDDPLVTDRPDFTESAVSVTPGRLQLESGYTFSRIGATEVHTAGEVLVRIGVVARAELRLALNSFAWQDGPGVDAEGLEDAAVGVKLELLEGPGVPGSPLPSLAVLVSTTVPTGEAPPGVDEPQPGAILAAGWTLSDRVTLGSNVGIAYPLADGDDRFVEVSGSASVGIGVTPALSAYIEAFGFAASEGPDTGFLDGGLTYLVLPNLQFDARAGIGVNDRDPDYFVGAGFAVRR